MSVRGNVGARRHGHRELHCGKAMSSLTRPALLISLLAAIAFSTVASAQWQGYPTPGIPRLPNGSPNLTAAAPKTADGKPDLSGIWQSTRAAFDLQQAMKSGDTIPFTAEGKRIFDERQAAKSKDDPSARCLPTGLPVRALLRTPL